MKCVDVVQLDADLIHALQLDVPHVIPLTSSGDVTMTVTLIDAGHCPGSVMFLFDGYFGRILYTGDFRYEANMLDHGPLSELRLNPVDVLYIDNTFCSSRCVLPSRKEATRQIINIVKQHPSKRVVFGLRGLGKEDVLIALAKCFGVKITVAKERYHLLEVLAQQEQFVTACESAEQTRFEVVELVEITRSQIDTWNQKTPTTAILLTGLFAGLGYQPFAGSSDVFVVPLSNHSPYSELREFVAQIRPKSVVPIVQTDPGFNDDPLSTSLLDRTNMECFTEYLNRSPMQNYHIPLSVLDMMNHTGYRTTRSRARTQASCCSRPKSDSSIVMSASTSGLKLLPTLFVSTSSAVATISESNSSILQLKCTNTSNTITTGIGRKPRVAVRPVKRCFPPAQHLQSPFIKQREQYQANFPVSFESQQKRYSMNKLHQKEYQWLASPACKIQSHVSSMSNKSNVQPATDVVSLQQQNGTYKRHPDMLDINISDVAHAPSGTVYHTQPVSGSDDSVIESHAESQSSHEPISTVFQFELQANTDGIPVPCSADCHQEGFQHMKKTTALGCVPPSVMVLNHNVSHGQIPAYDADGALNLTTSNTATAQPAFTRVQDSWNSILNVEHSSSSLRQLHSDSTGLLENVPVQTISDINPIRVSSTTNAIIADGTAADNVSVFCSHTQHWSVDKAARGTALESCADMQLVMDDRTFLVPAVGENSFKLSQHHLKRSHNIALLTTAENVNRTEEMSTTEVHPSTRLAVGMTLDNQAVLAGDENTAVDAVMKLDTLPAVVEFAPGYQIQKVPQKSGGEHETTVLKCSTASKSIAIANKQNARVVASTQLTSLHPKKKWRKQFQTSDIHRCLNQENGQLNFSRA